LRTVADSSTSLLTPISNDFTIHTVPHRQIGHPSSADQATIIPERLNVLCRRRLLDQSRRQPEREDGQEASEHPSQNPDDRGFAVVVGNQDHDHAGQKKREQTGDDDGERSADAFSWISGALCTLPLLAETERNQWNPVEVSQIERAPLLGQHGLAAVIAPIIPIRNQLRCEAIMPVDDEHGRGPFAGVHSQMNFVALVAVLIAAQAPDQGASSALHASVDAVVERAQREPDVDGAGLILVSLLSDEPKFRRAITNSAFLDERSIYILFAGEWGSRATGTSKDRALWHRVLVEAISAKPALIDAAMRADRYDTYLRRRERRSRGAQTINSFTFFSFSPYADDLAEVFIESLRKASTHPAEPTTFPPGAGGRKFVLRTAQENELDLLDRWQMLCGLCGRLDLIEGATAKNWRERFPELEKWFQKNRPYILWADDGSFFAIDQEAQGSGRPTPRKSRSIPELKPPWLVDEAN
jgi:hypothetical protein